MSVRVRLLILIGQQAERDLTKVAEWNGPQVLGLVIGRAVCYLTVSNIYLTLGYNDSFALISLATCLLGKGVTTESGARSRARCSGYELNRSAGS
jgi:hypothetical protein